MEVKPDVIEPRIEPFLPIRQEVGLILNHAIPVNGWERVFKGLASQGILDDKARDDLLILLCKRVEKLENDR
jgi:hypothetical protein